MKYNGSNLKAVLRAHAKFLNNEKGWEEKDKADFSYADLSEVNLSGLNLELANMRMANLLNAQLVGTRLYGADMYGANMEGVTACDAEFRCADLRRAIIRRANLACADLRDAKMCGADLRCANMYKTIMLNAMLSDADMKGADIDTADMRGAVLTGAKNVPFIPMACPDSGEFIGWKKARSVDMRQCVIKLFIPGEAERSSATGRKCRCDKALVMEIQMVDQHGKTIANIDHAYSSFNPDFVYKVGQYVHSDFDKDRWQECAPGIHFFINRQEAVDY